MLKGVVEARAMEGYRLFLRFEDGTQGGVVVSDLVPFQGVFAPLRERVLFQQVKVSKDLGTVYWPNGADVDPDVLYAQITGTAFRAVLRSPDTHRPRLRLPSRLGAVRCGGD